MFRISSQSIIMHGAVIRGDFCNITINRYCFIDEDTILRPSYMPSPAASVASAVSSALEEGDFNPDVTYVPMHIGKYTHIGKGCVIQAASIGLGCQIGNHCVISNRAILKDHVQVLDGSVVPSDFVAPPFAILAGKDSNLCCVHVYALHCAPSEFVCVYGLYLCMC